MSTRRHMFCRACRNGRCWRTKANHCTSGTCPCYDVTRQELRTVRRTSHKRWTS